MNKDIFFCQAIIPNHGIKTMSDLGVRVMLDTQELEPEQLAALFRHKGNHGIFIFAPVETPITDIDIPDITPEFKGEKTPSQRQRAIIYRIWEQNGKKGEFELYYRAKMDAINEKLKEQLD